MGAVKIAEMGLELEASRFTSTDKAQRFLVEEVGAVRTVLAGETGPAGRAFLG